METTVFSKHQSENSIKPIEGHQTHIYWCETLCQYLLKNDWSRFELNGYVGLKNKTQTQGMAFIIFSAAHIQH